MKTRITCKRIVLGYEMCTEITTKSDYLFSIIAYQIYKHWLMKGKYGDKQYHVKYLIRRELSWRYENVKATGPVYIDRQILGRIIRTL